jgi:hypothetical protein
MADGLPDCSATDWQAAGTYWYPTPGWIISTTEQADTCQEVQCIDNYDCGACMKCSGGSCVEQVGEDTKDECGGECRSNWAYELDVCTGGGNCGVNGVAEGHVCADGADVVANATYNCGKWSDCVEHEISADEYWVGYVLEGPICSAIDWQTTGITIPANISYQETVDSYSYGISFYSDPENAVDGDWSTYALASNYGDFVGYYYFNYTVPEGIINAIWQNKIGDDTIRNYSINEYSCDMSDSTLKLSINAYQDVDGSYSWYVYCYGEGNVENIIGLYNTAPSQGKVYEEAIFWVYSEEYVLNGSISQQNATTGYWWDITQQVDTCTEELQPVTFPILYFNNGISNISSGTTVYVDNENSIYFSVNDNAFPTLTCTIYQNLNPIWSQVVDVLTEYNTLPTLAQGNNVFYVTCEDDNGNTTSSSIGLLLNVIPPNYSTFSGSTTDFITGIINDTVINVSAVDMPVLDEPTAGSIMWVSEDLDCSAQDFDTNVEITPTWINVNANNLRPVFNSPARLQFYSVASPSGKIPAIYRNGVFCNTCSIVNVTNLGGSYDIVFTVTGFSNYSVGINANLTVWNSGSVINGTNATFYANYINISDGMPISTGACTITFFDGAVGMNYNAGTYEYTRSFDTPGAQVYDISCSDAEADTLDVYDSITITAAAIPVTPTDASTSCNGTKIIIFTAFGLISLAIIVLAGWLMLSMFNGSGGGSEVIIGTVVMGIAVAIIVFIGYIVINLVSTITCAI